MDATVRRAMGHADFAKKFKHPIKFNGTDFVETKLSEEEQFSQLRRLLSAGSLHIFLERYGAMLEARDLDALAETAAAETAEAKIWLERLRREPPSDTQRQKRARRRRWTWAKRQMVLASGFFSEDVMKYRDPKLFHELVGRHLPPSARISEPMKGSLSSYLMQRLDQETLNPCQSEADPSCNSGDTAEKSKSDEAPPKRQRVDTDGKDDDKVSKDDAVNEEGSGSEDGLGEDAETGEDVDITARRAHFLKSMRDRFVNGRESDFNYGDIDANSDLDDLSELGQDAEDRYFDAEE